MIKRFALFGMIAVVVLLSVGCSDQGAGSSTADSSAQSFNTSDKSVATNGNMTYAVKLINLSSEEDTWKRSQKISASTITKSPYSSLGQLVQMKGEIYNIEECSPSMGLQGKWAEILVLVNNPNSPMGVSTISFINNCDISKINSGDKVICGGYFIGTYESQNAMGGTVEGLSLIGNAIKKI